MDIYTRCYLCCIYTHSYSILVERVNMNVHLYTLLSSLEHHATFPFGRNADFFSGRFSRPRNVFLSLSLFWTPKIRGCTNVISVVLQTRSWKSSSIEDASIMESIRGDPGTDGSCLCDSSRAANSSTASTATGGRLGASVTEKRVDSRWRRVTGWGDASADQRSFSRLTSRFPVSLDSTASVTGI